MFMVCLTLILFWKCVASEEVAKFPQFWEFGIFLTTIWLPHSQLLAILKGASSLT